MRKTKAKVIAITGSVGKSSTKEAITQVLNNSYKVRSNYGSLNNELGLPLAILGEKNGFNLMSWFWCILNITRKTFLFDQKVEVFVLECGIDKPGDMDAITEIISPDITVITSVESVHTLNFANFEELVQEKWKLAKAVKKGGTIIANYDNAPTHTQIPLFTEQNIITFGLNSKADFYGHTIQYDLTGTDFLVHHDDEDHHMHIPLLGKASVYTSLPAIIIGQLLHCSWMQINDRLSHLKPLPGRLTFIPGINNSMLLEGSYNASPASMKMSMEIFRTLPAKRKIAIVGDMRELGEITLESHTEILNNLLSMCELVITLGPNYAEAIEHLGKYNHNQAAIKSFLSREELIDFIVPKVAEGDLILIKGSQNTIMLEKVSIRLMADPSKADELLPRQYGKWKTM